MMKMLRLLLISYFAFIIVGCSSKTIDYEFEPFSGTSFWSEPSYDSTITHASLDGFQIGMSPIIAKQVAEEKEYMVKSFFGVVAFEDIIEAGLKEKSIWLKRFDKDEELDYEIMLHFNYGKIESVQLEHEFKCHRQKAEEIFDSYLERFPQLTIEKETENYRIYRYQPNIHANMTLIFKIYPISKDDRNSYVSISVSERNYTEY